MRGSILENLINHTNDSYREKHLVLIQKIPTPITPIEIDKASRHITLVYFDQKSTVDYIDTVQEILVCSDAKECMVKIFPLQNIHLHQVQLMKKFEEQGGVPFTILYYTGMNEMYYLPFDRVLTLWERVEAGGRESSTYNEVDKQWRIHTYRDMPVHYLEEIQKDSDRRN